MSACGDCYRDALVRYSRRLSGRAHLVVPSPPICLVRISLRVPIFDFAATPSGLECVRQGDS
jgi:hypothetical protein